MKLSNLIAASVLVSMGNVAIAGSTIDVIKQKGFVQCGVNTALTGFSAPTSEGKWEGLDVDFCQAIAAAILGDKTKTKFTPLTSASRFTALQSKEVDVLTRNTTWTLSRDTKVGLNFVGVNFYDGQAFMVTKESGITSALQLDGATVCIEPGTTTELNLADYFRAENMAFEPVVIESQTEAVQTFFSGRCDVYTTDASGLASYRRTASNPDDYVVLPEIISKEPLGPAVRHGDEQFADIVRWTHMAMLEAEEKGITSGNIDDFKTYSKDPSIQRMLGVTLGMGEALGVSDDWAYNIIKQVGNYGESYDRNVKAKLGLDRGFNALWTDGGLMYPAPIR